ncbi:hypothetical protein MIND_01342700 [Mycena indigotica]|uniref:Uncharacterized protein n=1 Tax=Mycena indigotica TaxID=2126181 RepID=A0A8H6S0N2_9AGAR|nr:uncharacterized protein MIND_01342700 [Mycena indigotica]KAF7290287.1 hypothetical protein MIND_01342700 [Mycena indigotica]
MSFRPGIQQPQAGPYVTHPSLPDIRDVSDAHKVLEAVRMNLLPLIRRRLLAHERAQLRSGNVFVWEESDDVDEGGLTFLLIPASYRSQSRMRGDYLFYEEKVDTTPEEKQAKAIRRAKKASESAANLPPPPKRKDRPAKQDGLTKQTYSVTVRLPGAATLRKWHIVAYFSAADFTLLPVVDHYDYLRNIRVPDGVFMSSRIPSSSLSDEPESPTNSYHGPDYARESRSPQATTPTYELMRSPFFQSTHLGSPSDYSYPQPGTSSLPPPDLHERSGMVPRVSLPPLSALGYPSSGRPSLNQRHSTSSPNTRLSSEDRRILDRLRVTL